MLEDGPDHRRVFDAADDPHGALALRTDQGICFVYLLYQTRPIPAEDLFILLRFEDTGNDVIAAFLLPKNGVWLRYLGIDWPPLSGNLPLWRGNQEFTSRGTLSYNWLEKNVVEGRKSKIKK